MSKKIRNIAVIAHVDHGKTSLVNELLKQGKVFRENEQVDDRVMDSNALERERGITILAKNASFFYNDIKINVIDTPGHADFGGEVERILKMADGVLLVVDSYEGTMPQTRFVLSKALELNHKIIVVINKIDRADARLDEVGDEVLELLMDLNATEEQLDSPIIYASARQGIASTDKNKLGTNLIPLFEAIIKHIPEPKGDNDAELGVLVSASEHSDYLGKMAVGRIESGTIKIGDNVVVCNYFDKSINIKTKITGLFEFAGMKKVPVESAIAGDIVTIGLATPASIGDTICSITKTEPIEFVKISEPSVEMTFSVNDSPFAGKEGKFVTSRHLRERLYKEVDKDLSLRVRDGETTESFYVRGRGEMHLSILIENMRREGFEFAVSQPRVLFKEIDGIKCEPIDRLVVDVPEHCVGSVMQTMGTRKGELLTMNPAGNRMKMEFLIPSRGLFGYKSDFLTETKGEGILASIFHAYEPYKGDIERRTSGSLVAFETGTANAYGLFYAEDRGQLLVAPGEAVYGGMVVGINPKNEDIAVNVCKTKQLTNMRTSSSDDSLRLSPKRVLSLEGCLEFLADDELLEVTPQNIRIRKQILDHGVRVRTAYKNKQ